MLEWGLLHMPIGLRHGLYPHSAHDDVRMLVRGK